uniref:Hypoxanthine phosphoribosyltransferase n=1 Tax=Candidatus Aschnera chinzeii TaxID=1485666 RepID=A0AAT9G3W5_9ENTR|nr:MAG: hypoxanthine phosphoribosyltransferase [Candidatus Aschnera chinzeii]
MTNNVKILFSEHDIKYRINEMAKEITKYYSNITEKLVLIGLLKGSFIFMADLCRRINIPHEVDFMTVSSYGNGIISSGDVKIIKDLDEDIRNKHIIIVEDLVDSGNTLKKVYEILELRGPNSITICTLLDKNSKRMVDISITWIGYSINDEFVVGYGIDYAQQYRHLPYIGYIINMHS